MLDYRDLNTQFMTTPFDTNAAPLDIKRITVIGVSQWPYKYTSVADAQAGVMNIAVEIKAQEPTLDLIEILVEFESGEHERCAYKSPQNCCEWLARFAQLEA